MKIVKTESNNAKIVNGANAFEILISKLYSQHNINKHIVREIASNAFDAKAKNFNITVEEKLTCSEIIFEDDGESMDHNFVMQNYASFLDSKKHGDSDTIGRFGVGGKIIFSITERYFLECTQKGEDEKRVYLFERVNKNAIPRIRLVKKVDVDPETQGTAIKFTTQRYYNWHVINVINALMIQAAIKNRDFKISHLEDGTHKVYTPKTRVALDMTGYNIPDGFKVHIFERQKHLDNVGSNIESVYVVADNQVTHYYECGHSLKKIVSNVSDYVVNIQHFKSGKYPDWVFVLESEHFKLSPNRSDAHIDDEKNAEKIKTLSFDFTKIAPYDSITREDIIPDWYLNKAHIFGTTVNTRIAGKMAHLLLGLKKEAFDRPEIRSEFVRLCKICSSYLMWVHEYGFKNAQISYGNIIFSNNLSPNQPINRVFTSRISANEQLKDFENAVVIMKPRKHDSEYAGISGNTWAETKEKMITAGFEFTTLKKKVVKSNSKSGIACLVYQSAWVTPPKKIEVDNLNTDTSLLLPITPAKRFKDVEAIKEVFRSKLAAKKVNGCFIHNVHDIYVKYDPKKGEKYDDMSLDEIEDVIDAVFEIVYNTDRTDVLKKTIMVEVLETYAKINRWVKYPEVLPDNSPFFKLMQEIHNDVKSYSAWVEHKTGTEESFMFDYDNERFPVKHHHRVARSQALRDLDSGTAYSLVEFALSRAYVIDSRFDPYIAQLERIKDACSYKLWSTIENVAKKDVFENTIEKGENIARRIKKQLDNLPKAWNSDIINSTTQNETDQAITEILEEFKQWKSENGKETYK